MAGGAGLAFNEAKTQIVQLALLTELRTEFPQFTGYIGCVPVGLPY